MTEGDQSIEVPVREEHVELEKQPVVYEEVGVGKQQTTEHQQVSDTVRREAARIERRAMSTSAAGKPPVTRLRAESLQT